MLDSMPAIDDAEMLDDEYFYEKYKAQKMP